MTTMKLGLTNCIALGVPDRSSAASLYQEAFGFEVTEVADEWTEMRGGDLRIFLCEDQVREPAFSVNVEDMDATRRRLESLGFSKADYQSDELFMRDPYGYVFNIYPASR
ncbi:MAG: Glyoxalase-like domain [Fimbriimonadaceae bacterium]|jgi:hypothetical protein|nr:Glyoxalase-like domain [Fimbriimonadaceae bacterium]